MLRLISRLVAALVIGLTISVWIIQRNDQVQKALTTKLLGFLEKEWSSKIVAEFSKINFFTSSIYIKNGIVTSLKHKNCFWKAKEAKIYFSPLALIFGHKIRMTLTLYGIEASSGLDNGVLEISEHLKQVLTIKSRAYDVKIQEVHLRDVNFNISAPAHTVSLLLRGHFDLSLNENIKVNKGKHWQAHLGFDAGDILLDGSRCISGIALKCDFLSKKEDNLIYAQANGGFNIALYKQVLPCTILGKWQKDAQTLLVQNSENKFNLTIAKNGDESLRVNGFTSLPLVVNLYSFFSKMNAEKPSWVDDLFGDIGFDVNVKYGQQFRLMDGVAALRNLKYKKFALKSVELKNVDFDGSNFSSEINTSVNNFFNFVGTANWNQQAGFCDLTLTNSSPLEFFNSEQRNKGVDVSKTQNKHDGLVIEPNSMQVKSRIGKDLIAAGVYKCVAQDKKLDRKYSYKGNYIANTKTIKVTGKTNYGDYNIEAKLKPTIHISKWTYEVGGKKFVDLNLRDNQSMILDGTLRYTLIRSFLSPTIKQFLIGKNCVFHMNVDQNDLKNIQGKVFLEDGKFYLPQNRNLIKKVYTDFQIDVLNKQFTCSNSGIDFCKGAVTCPKIVVTLDENNALNILHAPLKIEDLLVNWKRDLYALVYGTVLVNKLPDKAIKITGDLILKSSLLKENLFANESSFNIYSPIGSLGRTSDGMVFDFHVTNEKPIKVKTSSLEAEANLDLKVVYSQNKFGILLPQVSGVINLENGYLKFLKNKLNIDYGRVQFLANQINDPTIDLIARNRINKYLITLQTTGTLQKPTIILESNPDLAEEQVLSLLLGGSENASLQTDLPAMLMQNISTLVLGSRRMQPQTSSLFEKITKPLKYVQITPNFTDQSGRGGIKGVISVDLNKQLHAQIQKNFSLQDDWDVQVEYMLSDDINIKGVSDQRGEVGAEVEVRLKL